MSQHVVGIIVSRLLTDRQFRIRFALDRIQTLAELRSHGFDLTSDELDLFLQVDARVWFSGAAGVDTDTAPHDRVGLPRSCP
jgi:hypothetical protein